MMKTSACVVRYGGIGDDLVASSVLPALKKRYDYVEVISQSPQSCVFENNPYIDRLIVHKPGDIPGDVKGWHDWHRIRQVEYDFFVNLSHSMETETCLLPYESKQLWPEAYRRKKYGRSYVEVAADICGLPADECKPEYFPTDEETLLAERTFTDQIAHRPCVGWILGGTRIDKIHPASTMIVSRLLSDLRASVVLFGAPGRDHDMARQIQDYVRQHNGSTDGLHAGVDEKVDDQRWPIRRILAQMRQCDLVISPDTGPAWSLAMMPVPQIMLLSHASAENITKGWTNTTSLHADQGVVKCHPCHRLWDDICDNPDATGRAAACISSITVQSVIDAARVWLFLPEMAAAIAAPFHPAALRARIDGLGQMRGNGAAETGDDEANGQSDGSGERVSVDVRRRAARSIRAI